MVKCLECNEPATWERCTQFAGNHPYCEEHAKQQSDWNDNDSYLYWSTMKAAEHMSDKGYQESTHEKQAEFARKRHYD